MTAEAPEWAVPLVESALAERIGQGTVAEATIQEEVGIGGGDLRATLDVLREGGKAVEEAPGEWRAPYEDEERAAAAPPTAPSIPDDGDEREHASPVPRRTRAAAVETKLTAGMAKALGPDALGQIVHAGIEDAGEAPFVLMVEP